MKTSVHRLFAVGDHSYMIELQPNELNHVVVKLSDEILMEHTYATEEVAMMEGKRFCYLDAGRRQRLW